MPTSVQIENADPLTSIQARSLIAKARGSDVSRHLSALCEALDVVGDGTVRRWRSRGNIDAVSNDARDRVTFIAYDLEGEVLDPDAPTGKILYVANNRRSGYRVGEGSTPDPVRDMALGYTHVAPTVEGGGAMGRWGDMYTPEQAPWSLHARGVTNLLPVREDITATQCRTYVLSTDLS